MNIMIIDSCAKVDKTPKSSFKKDLGCIVSIESDPSEWNSILSTKSKEFFSAAGIFAENADIYNDEIENKLLKLIKKNNCHRCNWYKLSR